MHGFPLEVAKTLVRDLVGSLRRSTASTSCCSRRSSLLAEASLPRRRKACAAPSSCSSASARRGTELVPALRRALALPRVEGVCARWSSSRRLRQRRARDVRVDPGEPRRRQPVRLRHRPRSRFLIEGWRGGPGEPFVVCAPRRPRSARALPGCVEAPVLTAVRVEAGSTPSTSSAGAARRAGRAAGDRRRALSRRFPRSPRRARHERRRLVRAGLRRGAGRVGRRHPALRILWARERVAALADAEHLGGDETRRAEITRLGLATDCSPNGPVRRRRHVVRGDGRPSGSSAVPCRRASRTRGRGGPPSWRCRRRRSPDRRQESARAPRCRRSASATGGRVLEMIARVGASRPRQREHGHADVDRGVCRGPLAGAETLATCRPRGRTGGAERLRTAVSCRPDSRRAWIVVLSVAADGRVVRVRVL